MDRPWLALYPPATPAAIDAAAPDNLVEVYRRAVREHAGWPAFTSFGATLTYDEIGDLAGAFSAWLARKGSRRGTASP